MAELRNYANKTARRNALFLEGFGYRLAAQWDEAEAKYLAALSLAPDNYSINLELASLYCKQQRYAEAEAHARTAYQSVPTNPFVLDIMVETLLGRQHLGLPVNQAEIGRILGELRIYGDAPGSSFFLVREGQVKARDRQYPAALALLGRAIERTPSLVGPYFIRADIRLKTGDIQGAEQDFETVNRLLTEAGGFSKGDEAQATELEIKLLIERRQYDAAKARTERSNFIPRSVERRLIQQLAQAIIFDPASASASLKKWASANRKTSWNSVDLDRYPSFRSSPCQIAYTWIALVTRCIT
jgi:tetratricopeptide (TPR) repeat protein